MKRGLRTRAILAATSIIAAGAAMAIPLSASAAPSPTEVAVYPADQGRQVLTDKIIFGGTTGYLHQPQGTTTYVWTTYGTGHSRIITGLPNSFNVLLAGADRMAYQSPLTPGTQLTEINFADGSSRTFALPTGVAVQGVSDNHVLARAVVAGAPSLEVLTFASDESFTSQIVSLPNAGPTAPGKLTQPVGDPPMQVVGYRSPTNVLQYALVDLTTATAHAIADVDPSNTNALLSSDHVAMYSVSARTVQFFNIADILAGTETHPPAIATPLLFGQGIGLIGDRLAIRAATISPFQVTALSPDGTSETLVPSTEASNSGGSLVDTADGAALLAGGTSPDDWAVRRLAEDSDGAVQNTAVHSLHGPFVNAGVTISHGQLRHIDALPDLGVDRTFVMFGHDVLDPSGTSATLPLTSGLTLPPVATCAPGVACVVQHDIGGRVALISANNRITLVSSNAGTVAVNVPPGSSISGSSNDYLVINNPATFKQYVTPTNLVLPPARPLTAAAVSFDTLWSSAAGGLLTSTNLLSNSSRLVSTGGSCRPQELQATQRWVYWSCGGNAPAGVIDLQTNKRFSVPVGHSLLGDGFLVRHLPDGSLVSTDFHTDAVTGSVTLANVPQGPLADDRNVTYSVDPFGGDIAYVAGDNSVHVVDPDVPRSTVAIGSVAQSVTGSVTPPPTTIPWKAAIALSRPVSSWTVQVHKASTGVLVHDDSGGLTENTIELSWDGLLPDGTKAVSGRYKFSLSVTPVGESAPVTLQLPTDLANLTVRCGQPPFRSYDCDGSAAFLGVRSDGEGHWISALPSGGLFDHGFTDTWFLGAPGQADFSALVPFGDFNGDGFNDLIARDGAGTLWAYDGFGEAFFGGNPRQKIGSGWNVYNSVFSPGDLDGDGHADLVGRDASGNLYLYRGSGKSTFAPKLKIGSGWSGLTIIGAGDLTGDGLGDVVGIDSSGRLWLWAGKVNGLAAKVQIGTGWSVFNAVIGAGDVNDDGHNDLIARKSNGVLMLYPGTGTGHFGAGVQIGTGFQAYSRLF